MRNFIILLCLFSIKLHCQCTFKTVSMGGYKVIALKEDNTLWTWGYTSYYPGVNLLPTQIGTDTNWSIIRTGSSHTLAIKSDGTLWAWGNNSFGQLGIAYNSNNNLSQPTQVGTDNDWAFICAGNTHSAAIKMNGTLWTWGRNAYGQLGNGTWLDNGVPTQVGTDTNWQSVDTYNELVAAIKTDHTIWTWGNNEFGGLGNGTTIHTNTPAQVGDYTDWKSIEAGRYHCLAIRNDKSIWAWGLNDFGQLGDGTTTNKLTPVQIGNDTNWKEISTTERHCLAIKIDGTLWSWGRNQFGELGIGNQIDQHNPVQIGTESDWNKLGYGPFNSFAIKTDGVCWFWGRNNSGQLLYQNANPLNTNAFVSSPLQNNCTFTLGINSLALSELNIYPNPATNWLYISNPMHQTIDAVSIINLSGMIVKESYSITDKVNVEDLSAGIYIIKVSLESENYFMKFIKN